MKTVPTRNGKIARLPKIIRDRLNQQLRDGVPGKDLVHWLNNMREVQDVLLQHFSCRQITEQNLSEWKQGGYQDWLTQQERRAWVRQLCDEAEDMAEDSGTLPFTERISAHFEVTLAKVVEQLRDSPADDPAHLDKVLQLSRELARHRSLSLQAALWRAKQADLESEKNAPLEERAQKARMKAFLVIMQGVSQAGLLSDFEKRMSPEQAKLFNQRLDKLAHHFFEPDLNPGFADPIENDDPIESD